MERRGWGSSEFAHAWKATADARKRFLWTATEKMFTEARVASGMRVLDLGAGTGDTSIMAAERVGPRGSVVATDVSHSMIEATRAAVRAGGLTNVTARVMDVESIDLPQESFDAVIARLALMFADLGRALQEIRRVLVPGGRLSALVWGPLAKNPYNAIILQTARAHGGWGDAQPEMARAFSIADGDTYRRALARAGYREIALFTVPAVRKFASTAEAIKSVADSPISAEPLMLLPREVRKKALGDVRDQLRQFELGKGQACDVPAELVVVAGKK